MRTCFRDPAQAREEVSEERLILITHPCPGVRLFWNFPVAICRLQPTPKSRVVLTRLSYVRITEIGTRRAGPADPRTTTRTGPLSLRGQFGTPAHPQRCGRSCPRTIESCPIEAVLERRSDRSSQAPHSPLAQHQNRLPYSCQPQRCRTPAGSAGSCCRGPSP